MVKQLIGGVIVGAIVGAVLSFTPIGYIAVLVGSIVAAWIAKGDRKNGIEAGIVAGVLSVWIIGVKAILLSLSIPSYSWTNALLGLLVISVLIGVIFGVIGGLIGNSLTGKKK
jgi:ABC-type Mn2+/Zn2+ transport system permease subunit